MPGAPHTANNVPAATLRLGGEGHRPREADPHGQSPGRQRAVCPYPQYAQYTGPLGGSTTDPNNFTCGGNLEANIRAQCSMVKTRLQGREGYGHEQRRDRRPCGALREAELGRKTTARAGWPERAPAVTHSFMVGPSRKAIKSLASTIGPDSVLSATAGRRHGGLLSSCYPRRARQSAQRRHSRTQRRALVAERNDVAPIARLTPCGMANSPPDGYPRPSPTSCAQQVPGCKRAARDRGSSAVFATES